MRKEIDFWRRKDFVGIINGNVILEEINSNIKIYCFVKNLFIVQSSLILKVIIYGFKKKKEAFQLKISRERIKF